MRSPKPSAYRRWLTALPSARGEQELQQRKEDEERKLYEDHLRERMRMAQALVARIEAARPGRSALLTRCIQLKAETASIVAAAKGVASMAAEAADAHAALAALVHDSGSARPAPSALVVEAAKVGRQLKAGLSRAAAAAAEGGASLREAEALEAEVAAAYWAADDRQSSDLARTGAPGDHTEIAQLIDEATAPLAKLREAIDEARASEAALRPLRASFAELKAHVDDLVARDRPQPPGSRPVSLRPLTADEEAEVDDALAPGPASEQLSEFMNVPVTRHDMRTLNPTEWLNDEVINLFFKLLEGREIAAVDALKAGAAESPPSAVDWPRCHFCQTNFYTKLVQGGGYDYKNVRRWTKKYDVFSKDLIIVPIHCHGNHWTLAVINLKLKRFEYYDSLRGSEDLVLIHLRKWIEDESMDKKKVPFDTSGFQDVAYKAGTPQQRNGYDCGVFMTRTADFLARDGVLNFGQEHMEYFRRRMVLEILQKELLSP